tara:strand:+ start:728 stop:1081 length:354 start_codon:yes stop_codon:yes gene_type:complete
MKIAIFKERWPHETREGATAEAVKKFADYRVDACIEKGAGQGSSILDSEFKDAVATIVSSASDALDGADIVLNVQRPMISGEKQDEHAAVSRGHAFICQMNSLTDDAICHRYGGAAT